MLVLRVLLLECSIPTTCKKSVKTFKRFDISGFFDICCLILRLYTTLLPKSSQTNHAALLTSLVAGKKSLPNELYAIAVNEPIPTLFRLPRLFRCLSKRSHLFENRLL